MCFLLFRFKVTNGSLRPAVLSLSRVNFTSFNGGKYHQYDRNERIYKRKFLLDVNNVSRPFVIPRRSYGMLIARLVMLKFVQDSFTEQCFC